jgi:hypothetical protein
MGSQGTTTVNFGAFPGAHESSVAVTGQSGIVGGSLTEAWLRPEATSDHSVDEHYAEFPSIKVWASAPSAGVGFTIYARYEPPVREGLSFPGQVPRFSGDQIVQPTSVPSVGGTVPRVYGQWTVAWVWN